MDRRILLAAGLGVLVLADIVLATLPTVSGVMAGVALWGLHMGLTQGVLAAMVADAAPDHLRGTAFGVFNLASGVSMLAASMLAGVLWACFGALATFAAGGVFAGLATLALVFLLRRPARG
jgi:MFS family permease